VGHAVQHRALEAERGDAAFELVGRGSGIVGGQRREGGETGRMSADCLVQAVVDAPRQRHRDVGWNFLRRRRAMGQHLDVDAGLVHFRKAQRAEIEQAPVRLARPSRFDAGEMARHFRIPIVLLDRDDRAFRFLQHARFRLP